jgi:1,4-dihydroxy-2-naphthoate octaprenyltransferase
MGPKIKAWIGAMRLRTLPLATASIVLGSALAVYQGGFRGSIFALCLLTALLLQMLSNFANDYGDAVKGTDNDSRVGPMRAVQSGVITQTQMKSAIVMCALLAVVSGLALLAVGLGRQLIPWLVFLGLGLLAVIAAMTYTMGRSPYGYKGLGDISVFLFFGLLGVVGSCYLHTGQLVGAIWLPAVFCGLLSAAVLNINNIRDLVPDRAAGKMTLAVRLGERRARLYHQALVYGALLALMGFLSSVPDRSVWLALLVAPLLMKSARCVLQSEDAAVLDGQLKQTAKLTLLTNLILSAALVFGAINPL